MGKFNLFHRTAKSPPQEIKEENVSIPKNTISNRIKQFVCKYIGLINTPGKGRKELVAPEFSLDEIRAASYSDSYIAVSLLKYKSLIFKAGYTLKSENDKAVSYLKTRFKIMSISTGKPIDTLFQEIADDLVTFSNAFIIKARSDKISFPNLKISPVFSDMPVAGYFRLDPCNVYMEKTYHGKIKNYVYRCPGCEDQIIKPIDMIHIYMDKQADNNYGTPRILSALEDVKLLRSIEGGVMSLIYRFSMPIYQWIVGVAKEGMYATDSEIDAVKKEVTNMAYDGCIVTNERTAVKVIGAEGNAIDVSKYLEYFERRCFTALNISESAMGRGGTKQDADSMESQMHDTVKYIQRTLSIFFENYILTELLLEGGFNPISNESDMVTYVFDEISLDTKIKLENHEMNKYQSNMITFDEVRHAIGKKSDDVDFEMLYSNLISQNNSIEQIEAKADNEIKIAKETAKLDSESSSTNSTSSNSNVSSTVKGNGKTQSTTSKGTENTVKSTNMPTNQYGTTSVKIKESAQQLTQNRLNIHNKYKYIFDEYKELKENIVINKLNDSIFINSANDLLKNVTSIINYEISNGADAATNDIKKQLNQHVTNILSGNAQYMIDYSETIINNLFKDIKNSLEELEDTSDSLLVNRIFDKYEYRIECLLSYVSSKTYWLGYIDAVKYFGIKKIRIDFNSEADKKEHNVILDIESYDINEIPAYHPFCQCRVSLLKGDLKDVN